jgi:hypothetical protein
MQRMNKKDLKKIDSHSVKNHTKKDRMMTLVHLADTIDHNTRHANSHTQEAMSHAKKLLKHMKKYPSLKALEKELEGKEF